MLIYNTRNAVDFGDLTARKIIMQLHLMSWRFIMAILKVDTISGIGTEGPVFEGDIEFTSQNFLTLPKGDTTQRGRGRGFDHGGFPSCKFITMDRISCKHSITGKFN